MTLQKINILLTLLLLGLELMELNCMHFMARFKSSPEKFKRNSSMAILCHPVSLEINLTTLLDLLLLMQVKPEQARKKSPL